jgi:hypothetical protein
MLLEQHYTKQDQPPQQPVTRTVRAHTTSVPEVRQGTDGRVKGRR